MIRVGDQHLEQREPPTSLGPPLTCGSPVMGSNPQTRARPFAVGRVPRRSGAPCLLDKQRTGRGWPVSTTNGGSTPRNPHAVGHLEPSREPGRADCASTTFSWVSIVISMGSCRRSAGFSAPLMKLAREIPGGGEP